MDSDNSPSVNSISNTKSDVESNFYQDLENSKPPLMVKSPSLPKLKHEGKYSKVLVIYTGGTIGMVRTEDGGMGFSLFLVSLFYLINDIFSS